MKSILLIDDEEQLRKIFALALRKGGYHVIEAENGTTGLALARQHLPDLILTDVHMPGGDGSTLLRDIRQDPALSAKQVVLMTGRPDLITPRKGMEEGADDFLTKPVGVKELIACVAARFRRASVSWRVEDQMLEKLRSHVPAHLPHEFFTPIAGIIGLAEILRDPNSGLGPDDLPAVYNDLYDSALRLHRTLRNYLLILDLDAPPESETAPKTLSAVELERAMNDGVAEALRLQPRRADVTLRVTPCPIAIKGSDLSRVVDELVHNACKFSRAGTPVEIGITANGVLSVTDKGRGMSAEEIAHIGAFQQFDRKKQEQQGLGLGLVLVQKLAARAAAKFSLASKPGEGTTVQLAFPLARA
ncbi:MAG TPA: hybrid sensor histidine kinase/response regulator [Candidatus Methylacidiphilales bacterium]|jgi:signal transduction histidine kinase|nr:hybrid sensor histidine kinase/response regulator [Candidatus Methylacidiphilales bacterium]